MSSPSVRSSSSGNGVGDGTKMPVTLPATVSAGDTLLVFLTYDESANAAATPSGWSKTSDYQYSGLGYSVFCKKAAGTEGGTTLNITYLFGTEDDPYAYACYALSGAADPTIYAPLPSVLAYGTSTAPNSSSRAGAYGSQDHLFLSFCTWRNGTTTCSAYPTNYTTGQVTDRYNDSTGCGVAVACRQLTASSDDPGAFTISASQLWLALTVLVYPAGMPQTAVLDAAARSRTGQNITTVMGGISVPLSAAQRTRTPNSLTVLPGPLSIPLDAAVRARTAQNITTVMGGISIPLDSAQRTRSGGDLTVLSPLTLILDAAERTRTAGELTAVFGPVTLLLDPAQRARSATDIGILAGGINILLDAAQRARSGGDLAVLSPLTLILDAAERIRTAQDVGTLSPLTVTLDPAQRSRTADELTAVWGPVTVLLDAAERIRSAGDLTVTGALTLILDAAERTRSAESITLYGALTVILDAATRARTGQDVTASSGHAYIILDPAIRQRIAVDLYSQRLFRHLDGSAAAGASDGALTGPATDGTLLIARHEGLLILTRHEGAVTVDSEEGQGT